MMELYLYILLARGLIRHGNNFAFFYHQHFDQYIKMIMCVYMVILKLSEEEIRRAAYRKPT
jgi:hypothetical protein